MRTKFLADGHEWLRIADPAWADPLDPSYAQRLGGRWNPPYSFPTLYLNEDVATARLNLRAFISRWPYEPEDLRDDNGPVLVAATLPRRQRVADVHSRGGVASAGLPASYPLDGSGMIIPHHVCQPIGRQAADADLRGIHCRSASSPTGSGREVAWFPATIRSRARRRTTTTFEGWYWP